MRMQVDGINQFQEAGKIMLDINGSEYNISVNKFDEIVIIKKNYSSKGESGIVIKPFVSNEIRLT